MLLQLQQQRHFLSNTIKNHGNTVSLKENDRFLASKPKDMEYCALTDKEFKTAVMKKSNELQENLEWQYNDLRNKINEQEDYSTKEIKILKKNQTEILKLKNSTNEMKNTLECTGNRADHKEERISELEDRNIEMIQVE